LFDREIVYKGSRFKFEIALELEEQNDEAWHTLLNSLYSDDFYIGGGQFDGFGKLKVMDILYQHFDLSQEKDLNDYLNISVDLNEDVTNWKALSENNTDLMYDDKGIILTGENSFHHFGAGWRHGSGSCQLQRRNYPMG